VTAVNPAYPLEMESLTDEPAYDPAEDKIRWRKMWVLLVCLPLFGEVFHYVKAIPPLWALSKAFPVLSLPLCYFTFRGIRPPVTRQMMLSLLYLLLIPSFMAIFAFQQNFFLGMTAQVKLLPMFYFFSFLGLLRWLQPSMKELSLSFAICAALTFLVLITLWAVVPQSQYDMPYKVGDAPIFSNDSRGNRIRLPVYFANIGVLYCYRKFFKDKKILPFLGAATGFFLLTELVRNRSTVLAMTAVISIVTMRKVGIVFRLALLAILPLLILALFQVPYIASALNPDVTRARTTAIATDFLGLNPIHWIFGVGSLSTLDPGSMITYFNHFFFLADITWLGIIFEFGIIGALLVFAMPVRGIILSWGSEDGKYGAFFGALQDFLLFVLVVSPLTSMTLAPGEYVILLSVFVYAREWEEQQLGYQRLLA
jgi:hypothetical protein